jgi:hypothetical protein
MVGLSARRLHFSKIKFTLLVKFRLIFPLLFPLYLALGIRSRFQQIFPLIPYSRLTHVAALSLIQDKLAKGLK